MKRLILFIGIILLLCSGTALADGEQYLVLGADLTPEEQATVLNLLGVDNIDDYNVSYITNAQEKEALGNYLPAEVIGSRALSSVVLTPSNKGIEVNTQNINYVTKEMYQNALITAGVKNVNLDVAGPFSISGTAALVAATNAYQIMTGEEIEQESVDVANQELVVTQDLADEVGQEDAAELMAALKQDVIENDYTPEQVEEKLDELETQMDITISPENKEEIVGVMDRIKDLDIDENALREQAQNIYNNINVYLNSEEGQGFLASIGQFFTNLFNSIANLFSGADNVEQ